jgi:hypothetical protein
VKIIRNSARCNVCRREVESLDSAVTCMCGNLTVAGGRDHLRRTVSGYAEEDAYTDTSIIEPEDEEE